MKNYKNIYYQKIRNYNSPIKIIKNYFYDFS